MIPFRVRFEPGTPIWEQVVYAASKALVAGQMRPGDPFPSVRTLSKTLKINPNTAHKVVSHLVSEGLIEVRPGMGTLVARPPAPSRKARGNLLSKELEHLVVEARKLGLGLDDVTDAFQTHWERLDPTAGAAATGATRRRA